MTRLSGILVVAFLSVLPERAAASPILDQFNGVGESGKLGVGVPGLAQIFQVGIAGTLSRIDLFLDWNAPTSNLILDVRPTVGSLPAVSTASSLATQVLLASSLAPSSMGSYVSFDLGSFALPVTVGEKLAFVLKASVPSGTPQYYWTFGIPYGSGSGYIGSGSETATSWSLASGDLGFRTWVEPASTVPEPSTLLLVGSGAVAMASRWRRRRVGNS